MKYIDGFRNPEVAAELVRRIGAQGVALAARGRLVHIMEVCGSHTMAIGRYGIRQLLPECVELVSGPGCPVCVTEPGYIDAAAELAGKGAIVATFGDMVRVPGSSTSLAACRALGGDVRVCYSPSAALDFARANPGREVVFLAVGFETTVAPVASLVDEAQREGVKNLSLLTAFKLVPPALRALLADPDVRVDAFLCPAHVSAIIGARAYEPFAREGVPCVVAGFEPLDILYGIHGILEQLLAGESKVDNRYARVVRPDGNPLAQACIARHLEPVDASWRGIGVIPASGLALRAEYGALDAARRFGLPASTGRQHAGCRCGDVIKGKLRPTSCPLFAKACTPDEPVGPCMVSSEGTCAAYYKYELPSAEQEGS
jgi:hydrogenase expression/formation protein HypD